MKQYKELAAPSLHSITHMINVYAKDGWELAGYCKDRNEFTAIIGKDIINEAPVVEEHTAQWKPVDCGAKDFAWDYICTNCNHIISHPTNYCSACGAKMKEYKK